MIVKPVPLALGFDADDTLWHNEGLFSAAHTKFQTLLASHHDAATVDRALYATELRNLPLYGYGAKGFTLSAIETATHVEATWPTRPRLAYRLERSETLAPGDWTPATSWTDGTGNPSAHQSPLPVGGRVFFRLDYQPVAMPTEAPENAGFFKTYADFGL